MCGKFLLFFAIFSNLLAQAQKNQYIVFQPDFLTGKDYILEILTNEHQITKRSKEIHPSIDFYKIKMRKDHVLNGEIFYTFEVLEKEHNHTRDRKITTQYNPLKKIEIKFKTDEGGKYLALTNLENVKFQIRKNLTDKKIDSLAKAIKNSYIKDSYRNLRDDPTMLIANAEHQIITYFRYFGLKIKKGIDTFEMRYERFPFLRSPSLPFTSSFSLLELDENYILKISNEVNKKKISDEEYKSLAACCSKSLEDFKKNYKNSFDETIVFNKQQAFVDNYTLKLQASTANADGGTWMLTKTYKLTQ